MSVVQPTPEQLAQKEALYQKILAHRKSGKELSLEENDAIEKELASLIVAVPVGAINMRRLVGAGLAGVVGFLYNTGASAYVEAYSKNKWLSATKSTVNGAIQWKFYIDSLGNYVLEANLFGIKNYLSFTGIMGQCLLSQKYKKITAQNWVDKTFKLLNESNSENIGTWSDTNEIMYNRTNATHFEWAFTMLNHAEFKEIDHLIAEAYENQQ
jgi:hypothetical protein